MKELGFFRKELYTLYGGYRFLLKLTPTGSLTIAHLEFSRNFVEIYLHWPPGNPYFSIKFRHTLQEFQRPLIYPSLDILNRGITDFIWKSPLQSLRFSPLNCFSKFPLKMILYTFLHKNCCSSHNNYVLIGGIIIIFC